MDTRQLNDVQIINYVGQALLQQRFDELGAAARSDGRVLEQLASTLKQAQAPFFMFAGAALSKVGAPAVPSLLEALGDEKFPVRQMAAMALGDVGDPGTAANLIQALRDPQHVVRQAAAHSLGKIGSTEAVEPLLACLGDQSNLVRNAAVKALGLIGDARAMEGLQRMAAEEADAIAESAREAIERIQKQQAHSKEDEAGMEKLINHLKKAGWADFEPGEFLDVKFDAIGKAKVARNNWFALLKSIAVLDGAGLDAWNEHHAHFAKKSPAGMFTSGKYFVLILLVDTVAADAVERFGREAMGFLMNPDQIARGGGYTMVVIKDRKQLLMPKKVELWNAVRALDFVKRTHQAVADYINGL